MLTLAVFVLALALLGDQEVPPAAPSPCPDASAVQAASRQFLDTDVTVGRIRPVGVGGICEIEVLLRGERRIIYTDAAGSVAMLGPLVHLGTGRNLTREALEELNRFSAEELTALDGAVAFTVGTGKASLFYVADPYCRFCKEGQKAIEKLAEAGLITARFVCFALNDTSRKECASILCDGKGYAEYQAHYTVETPCEAGIKRLQDGAALLRSHGIASTPTYIFSDGRLHSGWLDEAQLRAALGLPAAPSSPAQDTATPASPTPTSAGGGE